MDLTKEEAKEYLLNYILNKKQLPNYDEIVYRVEEQNLITQYNFRGLLMYVYELKDK